MSTAIVPVDNNKIDKFFNSMPDIPMWVCKSIYDVGLALLRDDKADIGWFQYYGRIGHVYHGKNSAHHLSPIHHWQPAIFLIIGAQIMGLLAKTKELYADFVEADRLYNDAENEEGEKEKIIPVNYKIIEDKKPLPLQAPSLTDKIPTLYY